MFKPGCSGNPGGRRKDPNSFRSMRERLGAYSVEFADALIERALGKVIEPGVPTGEPGEVVKPLRRDPETADLKALELAMAYLWGKPPAVVAGEGGDGPARLEIVRRIIDTAAPDEAE